MDAADVLPVVSMSRPITTVSGSFSCLANSSMIRMLAWCGTNAARSDASMPDSLERLPRDLDHLPHRPAEDRRSFLAKGRPRRHAVAEFGECVVHPDRIGLGAVRAPHGRADAGRVAGADDDRAGAVAEQERDAAVGRVDDVAELLGADHDDVVREPASDEGIRLRDAVGEAGARGVDVVRGGGVRRRRGRRRWPPPTASASGCVTVATMTASMSCGSMPERAIASVAASDRQIDGRCLRDGTRAGDDAGALADPLVARVDRADEVLVGDDEFAPSGTVGVDPRVRGPGGLDECDGHAASPISAAAAARSSGDFTATEGTPRSARLARPTRVPAGDSSTIPVTPAPANEAMQRSQRTGEADLVHEQVDERGAGRDGGAVAVAPDGDAGVGCRHLGGRGAQRLDRRSHVAGVEGAGHLQGDDARRRRRRGRRGPAARRARRRRRAGRRRCSSRE